MAGTFFHLWLAQRAYPGVFPGRVEEAPQGNVWAAFLAGSVAPDMGYFPGGPRRFSVRVHHEHTGDFLRALRDEARDEVEQAFVAGWALHVYADVVLHPWVNACVATLLQGRSGCAATRRDLWHMRLEHGIDCVLLERDELQFMWGVNLCFPLRSDGPGLVATAAEPFYGEDVREVQIIQGMGSLKKWVRRLPRLFLWTGRTCPTRYRGIISALGSCARPLVGKLLGEWLEAVEYLENAAAVALPLHPEQAILTRATDLGSQALEAFRSGYADRFASLANLDLDSGQEVG